jgi:ribonuclease HII
VAWILGIDEAGYGPNLGPFVMSAVACRVAADAPPACLWHALAAAVRRGRVKKADARLHIDDSKVVYNAAKGLAGLERAAFSVFGLPAGTLHGLATHLCPDDREELAAEVWYRGEQALPGYADGDDLRVRTPHFAAECNAAGVGGWVARSVVVCPRRFNRLVRAADSKAAVVAYAFIRLLADMLPRTPGEPLFVFVDKQGGRNAYASQIQQAVHGMVVVVEEGAERSAYRVAGADRAIDLSFQPRADGEQMCVALASMVSKYLRELFMGEFNRFWRTHLPDLAPTAGYPADAPRYFAALGPVLERLGVAADDVWRCR